MKWEQIEGKWAAMTRRIRADYESDRVEATDGSVRGLKSREGLAASIADSMSATAKDPEFKTSAN